MALIPPWHLDCVVAIGIARADDRAWIASGFLYGRFLNADPDGKRWYAPYLVTNRHVFEDLEKKTVTEAVLRFNPRVGGPAAEFFLPFHDPHAGPLWIGHPDQAIDVAIIQVNLDVLDKHGMQFNLFKSNTSAATIQTMRQAGVAEGDFVYVLGFPMGLIGGERNFVMVRSGAIARVRDALSGASDSFLVDAFIFPGNSGGPVVIKPETAGIQGASHVEKAYLIGIVRGYLPYEDVAVSTQTNKPRVVFSENSGLASVYPIDYVDQTIDEDFRRRGSHVPGQELPQEPVVSPTRTEIPQAE